ncbi:MAG TPA: glutaredoxin family protein, partial [Thermoanaerobaculia bacterium]|nr:glutaredoxin family protein [Thermoanaerobaculia bacterium]
MATRGRRRGIPILAGAVSIALTAGAAGAEWLVLRDGGRLEIVGAPRVEGRRVLFTLPGGQLGALRAELVDLAATDVANRPPVPASAPAPAAPGRAAVLRLTDADVAHVDTVGEPTIRLFTTSWCGWCRKARALLTELGARFEERDIEVDAEAGREQARLAGPGAGVPVVEFAGDVLVGFSEARSR